MQPHGYHLHSGPYFNIKFHYNEFLHEYIMTDAYIIVAGDYGYQGLQGQWYSYSHNRRSDTSNGW